MHTTPPASPHDAHRIAAEVDDHVDADEILAALGDNCRDGLAVVLVFLPTPNATSWHPASTKATARRVTGPATVRYEQYADGGIVATVGPLDPREAVRVR